jgi:hypothetical protein
MLREVSKLRGFKIKGVSRIATLPPKSRKCELIQLGRD